VGGSYLRRSVWKKSPVWQFCATNLNVNAMSWHKFKNTDFQHSRSAVRDSSLPSSCLTDRRQVGGPSVDETNTVFNVTFGCPTAHFLGLGEGGLRRMMSGLGASDHVRLKWMTTLQATGGLALEEMVDVARTSPSEIDRLFDCIIDTYSPG
jgi:hypothetical protein